MPQKINRWTHNQKLGWLKLGLMLGLWSTLPSLAAVSQTPLQIGGGNVPGNLLLVPSVEYPTILSLANLNSYSSNTPYAGYFDSTKCYKYQYYATENATQKSHFYPTSTSSCSGADNEWSGNYLNWALTQTIDPFRAALTGGYRVVDTIGTTILEKARNTGQGQYNSTRSATKSVGGSNTTIQTSLNNAATNTGGYGAKFQFTLGNSWSKYCSEYNKPNGSCKTTNNKTITDYKGVDSLTESAIYEAYARVKVCVPNLLESNCKQYGANNYKPEGLLQKYADTLRYSVFGYLNDSEKLRDGGVLRAQQKFIGPTKREPYEAPPIPNPQREWDDNGLFISNPDGINSSMGTSISNSGVINYLNKFGQLTSNDHKSIDPVSELFYAATRYIRNKGNIASYTTTTPGYTADPTKWADGFPVITQWNDLIQYSCQKNIILGIGDVNTHRDKNLPGNTNSSEEPSVPPEVSSDSGTPVVTATQKIASLEGITINTPFTENNNSAYIAGLAYLANTQDLRPDLAGKQTISTYWMDVRERGVLANRANNQYWLAAKYGGFKVPKTFGDPLTHTASLDLGWWSDGDYLDNGDQRPRNFYVASDAVRMTQSLEEAFAKLVDEVRTTTTTLTANSTSLDTGTLIFQSLFDSSDWSGDLLAKSTSTDATVSDTELWSAAAQLDALSEANLDNRKIFTSLPATTDNTTGAQRSTTGINFTWNTLASSQQLALRATKDSAQLVDTSVAQNRLSYLRGSRALEYSARNNSNPFRARGSRLGDIVNSDPQYIHQQDFGYTRLSSAAQGFASNVATDYQTFRTNTSYKSRKPLILVGANDGMLHGFDASATGGQELFAYVPNNVIGNLYELTLPSYAHRYYVDGTPRISDAYINNSWKTLVVGSTGAGGNSIFALDITNPSNMSSSALLWEFSHAELGYTLGRPSLTALPNGKFGVVVSSGYGRTTSTTDGYLWILDAADGSILKQFTLPNSGDLGAPLVLDLDNNRISDRIYVADTHGNVWRVNTLGTDPSNWDAPDNAAHSQLKDATGNIIPLFIATDRTYTRQPITAPLDAAYLDENRLILAFGTGSFYRDTDADIPQPPNSPQIESFYGIIDDGTPVYSSGSPLAGRDQLTLQHILKEVSNNVFKGRAVTENPASNSSRGWLLDLVWDEVYGGTGPQGERVVTKAILGSNRVVFTSLIPSEDPCAAGGTSWLMSLSLLTGRRLSYSYFDYNGDGRLDNSDYITLDDNTQVPVSGISDPDEGIIKSPLTLTDNTNAKRYLCLASSAASSTAAGVRPGCIAIPNNSVTRLSWQQLRDAQ